MLQLNQINLYFKTPFEIWYYIHIVSFIKVRFNWDKKEWMEKRLSMSWAQTHFTPWNTEHVVTGDGRGYFVLSAKSLLFSVDLLPEVKTMFYILKHNPHLFFFLFKKSKLSPQRYKNSKYWSSWRMVHLTPQATRASAHYHPALPFVGEITPSGLLCYRLQIANI